MVLFSGKIQEIQTFATNKRKNEAITIGLPYNIEKATPINRKLEQPTNNMRKRRTKKKQIKPEDYKDKFHIIIQKNFFVETIIIFND